MSGGQFGAMRAVRPEHRFDVSRLVDWMQANIADFSGPLAVEQFAGGQSNPTYRLVTPNRKYVLRRKPPGVLLRGAHAIDREARILVALAKAGFPVAHVYGLCVDDAVIGSWFYVMDLIDGRIFWNTTFPDVPATDRPDYFEAMNLTLATLHGLDYKALGLENYGREGNYIERQINRWSRQYFEDERAGRDPNMDRLIGWLSGNLPAGDETTLVHGDYRSDNMIFHATEPRVLAVLDWELSTLGNPLADFAYHAMMYRMPPDILGGMAGVPLAELGLPSEADYVASYCRKAGRDGIPDLDFYVAFNMFRFAAILHGIKGRVLRGTAANEDAKAMAQRFERVASLGWQQAARASSA